jgi:hypothetical protein
MLRRLHRLSHIEIGKYPETTSLETLYRHHRSARAMGWLYISATPLMVSSLVEFMFGPRGWMKTLSMVVLIASVTVAFISFIPGICSHLWISSIDAALKARSLPIPREEKELDRAAPKYAMKAFYWFAVLIIGASLIHTSTSKPSAAASPPCRAYD